MMKWLAPGCIPYCIPQVKKRTQVSFFPDCCSSSYFSVMLYTISPLCDLDLSHWNPPNPSFSVAGLELFSLDSCLETNDISMWKHFKNYKCTFKIWGFIIGCLSILGTMQKKSLVPLGDRKQCRILQFGESTKSKMQSIAESIFFFHFVLKALFLFNNLWQNVWLIGKAWSMHEVKRNTVTTVGFSWTLSYQPFC